MSLVTFRSAGTLFSASNSQGTCTVATPSGFQAGDLLIAAFTMGYLNSGPITMPTSIPSGWNTLDARVVTSPQLCGALYWKIASGSEGSSQTWSGHSMGLGLTSACMQILAFNGDIDTANPIGDWGVSTATHGSGATAQNHPSVTPAVDGSALYLMRGKHAQSGIGSCTSDILSATNPAGFERGDGNAIYPSLSTYTRDGGFGTTTQSWSTTYSIGGTNADIMYSVIINAINDYQLPDNRMAGNPALFRASTW